MGKRQYKDVRMNKFTDKSKNKISAVTAIFILSFFLRLMAVRIVGNFYNPRMWEFGVLADNLLAGKGYSFFVVNNTLMPSAYMPPAFPFLLAGIFLTMGKNVVSFFIVQFVNCIFGALACVLIYLIAKKIVGQKAAFLSVFICSIYPAFLYINTQIHPIAIYTALYCLVCFLLFKFLELPSKKFSSYAGILSGITILFRSEFLILTFLLAAWIFLNLYKKRKAGITLVYLFAAIIIIFPWCVRNFLLFKRFTPTVISGYAFARGWNENATGAGRDLWPSKEPTVLPRYIKEKIDKLPPSKDYEAKRDDIFLKEAFSYIKNNPGNCLKLIFKKIYYFWWFDPTHYATRNPLYLWPWMVILPFFVFGAILSLKEIIKFSLLYVYILMSVFQSTVFFVLPRYRMVIEPFIVIIASYALMNIAEKLYIQRRY